MFAQGKVGYSFGNTKTPGIDPATLEKITKESKTWQFGFYIEPGIKYALTDNFSMVATLGGLSFTHNDPEKASDGDDQNAFKFNLFTSLNFGLVYSF
jgi:opacity protein-like surface antigen